MRPTTRRAPQTNRCTRSPRSRARRRPIPTCRRTTNSPDFELWDYTLSADAERPTHRKGSFVRQALLDGMSQAAAGDGNPFKYGFIGDTDTHNAAASNEEFNFTGKFAFENNAEGPDERSARCSRRGRSSRSRSSVRAAWPACGREQNTREAIFDAMPRKETFGTSGPMIKVRFFGSWDYARRRCEAAGFRQARLREGRADGRRPEARIRARRRRSWSWR